MNCSPAWPRLAQVEELQQEVAALHAQLDAIDALLVRLALALGMDGAEDGENGAAQA